MGVLTKFISKLKGEGSIHLKQCYFCRKKDSDLRFYRNEQNKKISVCPLCVEYAERRAYRKF